MIFINVGFFFFFFFTVYPSLLCSLSQGYFLGLTQKLVEGSLFTLLL